ncbi:MAG: alpha/beta hydrolase [Ignavibacteriales bacterium]|nr:alpha/beta hydrolase [Ignavibacteriales bacterium]
MEKECGYLRCVGSEIYYEVMGSGPALVFAHGLGGNHLSWWQQIPYFCRQFTCVTFSHRGFWPNAAAAAGFSVSTYVDDLTLLINHLELADLLLVAQSMGGWVCLEYARRHPHDVRGLVMGSTTGTVDFASIDHPEIEQLNEWNVTAEKMRIDLAAKGILAATGERMAADQPALEYLYRQINDLTPTPYKESIRKIVRSARTLPAEDVAQMNIPMLLITGEEDLVFPPGAAAALASVVPGSKLKCVEKAGHSVYFERADVFNRLADEFFKSIGT